MIDIHTHVMHVWDRKPFTAKMLLDRMDALGIDRFVVLPLIGPEGRYFYFGSEDAVRVYRRYPDRVIPFCCIDPRSGRNSPETDFSLLLERYKRAGCRGVGEVTANIHIDSPLCINLFRQCGKAGMPVLFHLYTRIGGSYGLIDDIGLPRLEKVLRECPETIFIGHAMAFWSEIGADVTEETRGGYPRGPVKSPGRLAELLTRYPNLYGDLSAGSGHNAITRDMDYGYKFLEEFHRQLLFGTDLLGPGQEPRQVDYFREIRKKGIIAPAMYKNITQENAVRILGL